MKESLAARTDHRGPVTQGFDGGSGEGEFAAAARALRGGGDGWPAACVGQRLVGAREGRGKASEQGLPAAPEIVHLGVERHAPLLGLPLRGLKLLRQPRSAGLVSSRRGRPGLLFGVAVPRRFARRKGAAPLDLCARDGDLPAKSGEAPHKLLPGGAALPQRLVETGQLRQEEAVPARVIPSGAAAPAFRLERLRVVGELFVLRLVFQSVFYYLVAGGV